ncbi:MAG: YdcF family protein [Deltaproteobacteria bacterium]|nr:YdcF family protein [Deltaproteobacteria bacterium]
MALIISASHLMPYMKKRIIYSILFGALILIGYLFFLFVNDMTDYRDEELESDAIVVLTGGMGRVEEGALLLLNGRAHHLILSGVNKESDLRAILFKTRLNVDASKAILESNSTNTYENAVEAAKIIRHKNFKKIILVTSQYHMKRAFYTFRKIIPSDVKIYVHPVASPNFNENNWYKAPNSIGIIAFEFVKFYWYRVWI